MSKTALSPEVFREHLLSVMDRKHHWAWPIIMGPGITKDQLLIHYQQEYLVYVRDFPVLLARVHGQNPPADVRRMLAENIYEEDTGGLSFGRSHPELFHEMMGGLGFDLEIFHRVKLLPASRAYRAWLDRMTANRKWVIGAAVMAIFVEGSVKDRKEILATPKPNTAEEIEAYVAAHPLVRHHGIAPHHMDLIRAHQKVESGHRRDAYDMVVHYVPTRPEQDRIITCLKRSLALWMRYRDAVARACGLRKPSSHA
jgi:pyrroloquinoline quinone (PQQ) biosynthesis protein C